jgi:DNA topoisomerase-3
VPTERGLALFAVLQRADPALVDPGVTAQMERLLDAELVGEQEMMAAIDAVCAQASRIIDRLREGVTPADVALLTAPAAGDRRPGRATKRFGTGPARRKQVRSPRDPSAGRTAHRDRAAADHRSSATETDRSAAGGATGRVPKKARRRQRAPDQVDAGAVALRTPGDGLRRGGRPTAHAQGGSRKAGIKSAKHAATETDPSRPDGETPLHIPFGNKATALQLGARYRAGGWYAPPGIDLSGFRERGWL